jgi:ATP-dependent exoDNAse (exonuclease V) alpha subunit
MAIYRFEAKVIARSQGRSATASAAYRAAESIEDERTGTVFDYTRKRGVLYAVILTPPNTPAWMEDRAQLWNAVEKAEKRKDAQLARDLLLSLPHELTREQRRDLVREFVLTEFVAKGMIADVVIHAPDRGADKRNHHAHVLLTMRELAGNGFGLKVREWNATEQLEAWRAHWADAVNGHLEKYGHEARVDHRSLADQGIDREPEPKQGSVATEMEQEGRSSHAGDDRRAAHARNEDRAALEAGLRSVAAEIFDLGQERARQAGAGGLPPGQERRVVCIGGQNFGFAIENRDDLDLARRIIESDALNQTSLTMRYEKHAEHLMLAWRVGDTPTREQMAAAAQGALKTLGMEDAKAFWVARRDEDRAHLLIVASKIHPETGRAYDFKSDRFKLSEWADQYERENGGIVCLRRHEANGLRDAIDARDPAAVLEALTRQRATFTVADLERALAKQIPSSMERAQFGSAILDHAEVVQLADSLGGATTRYTTRSVLASEREVLKAAEGLEGSDKHAVGTRTCDLVLNSPAFSTMRDEQRRAFIRGVGMEGLVIIDGQAGTGKSYTMAAIRTAYESEGYRVIGLAPTNAVSSDMGRDGFTRSGTVHSELFALKNGRTQWDNRTLVMADEAPMLDTKLMATLTRAAQDAGAKLILVGDDRQLASIDRGGMFGELKERYGAAALSTVARQHTDEDRRAASMMAEGNFGDALGIYEAKGSIHWTATQTEARAALVAQWAKDNAASPDKSRFVFAYTNADVKELNADIREVRRARGELGADHMVPTTEGWQRFATGDRIQFTGTNKKEGLHNGAVGTITGIEGTQLAVRLDGTRDGIKIFDAVEFQTVRHGYAGTIYRGQGRTLDQTYLYHSEHWRSATSYVALTRHREKAEIFVATDTLNTRPKGEPWMKATGGASALGHENYASAQRSYAKWQETNPQAAARHGFADYVQYVQDQSAKNPPAAENDRAADLRILARQMARVDERRAASQFYEQPMRPGVGDSPSPDSGSSRGTEQSYNDESTVDEPTASSHRKETATGGADTGGKGAEREVEDEAARTIREIAEAAKAREDDGRSRERDRGR